MKRLQHRVRIQTTRPISRFESWLAKNSRDGWELQLSGITEDLKSKSIDFLFDSVDDAYAFKRFLSTR